MRRRGGSRPVIFATNGYVRVSLARVEAHRRGWRLVRGAVCQGRRTYQFVSLATGCPGPRFATLDAVEAWLRS